MTKLTTFFDRVIDLLTGRNKRHNLALGEIGDSCKAIERFLIDYGLQDGKLNFELLLKNIGQAKIDVTTIAYKSRTRIKMAKDIRGKNLSLALEEVVNHLEAVKRALFDPLQAKTVLSDAVSRLLGSYRQLVNEVSNIEPK